MRKSDSTEDILREFIEDIKLAYGTGKGDKIDSESLDWPDLEVTYIKAIEHLEKKEKS